MDPSASFSTNAPFSSTSVAKPSEISRLVTIFTCRPIVVVHFFHKDITFSRALTLTMFSNSFKNSAKSFFLVILFPVIFFNDVVLVSVVFITSIFYFLSGYFDVSVVHDALL